MKFINKFITIYIYKIALPTYAPRIQLATCMYVMFNAKLVVACQTFLPPLNYIFILLFLGKTTP